MKRFSSLLFVFFILVACQNQVDITETIPANTATTEITLTTTPQPTIPPQATATQTTSIEFPDWVKNPDTQILLVPVGTQDKGYENMALFNAETGERYDIPFTEKIGDYFWMPDGSGFGFLPQDENYIILFSIEDGLVSNVLLSEESIRFYFHNSYLDAVQVTSSSTTDSNFLIIPDWYKLSPNGNHFEYQEKYDNTYTSIFDVETNQLLYLSDPNDGFFDLYSEFSPNSQFLAIAEVDEESECCNVFETLPTFRLRVYDVHTQQVVASYKNVTFPNWSPDGTKFLFQEWIKHDYGFYSYWGSPPCIYDTLDGTTNCYHESLTEEVNQFSSLDWSPDQSMIGYIHSDKGFCTIILSNTELQCILENLDPNNPYVDNFSWSPNSSYISFEYSSTGAYSDDRGYEKLGIANIRTGEYFSIGDDMTYPHLGLWRPSPNQ